MQINQLAAEQGHIAYQDSRKQSSPGWVPTLTLSGLDLQLPTFSTAPGRANPFVLAATLNQQSPLKASGELDIMSGAGKGKISLGKLALAPSPRSGRLISTSSCPRARPTPSLPTR